MAHYYAPRYQVSAMHSPYDAGYDSSSDTTSNSAWDSNFSEDVLPPFEYAHSSHSMSPVSAASTHAPNTPYMTAVRPSTSCTSRSSGVKQTPQPTSAMENEEERRKNRKREQNRESQRAFRRRQENRVKFLETKTLELETSSRQLRAENDQLRTELHGERTRNQELVSTMNMMSPSPLNLTQDIVPSIEADRYPQYSQNHDSQGLDRRVVW
ncbi:hypothetical protein EJ05DRAFT_498295 [Pseudovirgaria hyperparasitica]|uniref:BZIP domain-containing protein n=1 Tax=Pseudovirgaria hyperparasitica TaxID=470096 RepID=A0A6A6WEM7_9PEZI|nr:uncharacterized protein EJ05DRAFT_498295 [Pseudovirgaria hyperparasitica]KAF2760336.1 hypothetical protein EJ05DRAFT_498295 [Pseudovirgaria hyperparasitica]